MSLVVWLFVSDASPAYRYLLEQPEAGYGLLLLNLPALFVSRIVTGTPPDPTAVYLTCFAQWFALGFALSLAVWRRQAVAPKDAPTK